MMGKVSDILGSISPLYGIISGKGMYGKMFGGGGGDSEAKNINDEIAEKRNKEGYQNQSSQNSGEQADYSPPPRRAASAAESQPEAMKRGGSVKSKASSASKRADGIAQRGKTRGKFV